MSSDKKDWLSRIDSEAMWHWRRHRLLGAVKVIVLVAIAAAGVLTTSAGVSDNQGLWFAKPEALTVWGIITAVGAALNQWANSAMDHRLYKVTLRALETAVEFEGLDIKKANRLWNIARTNPETALRALAGQPEEEVA
jgi:hypothetical protein